MFDLAKAVSKSTENEKVQSGPSGCSLFYQTAECKLLLQEVFRFEGWPDPDCLRSHFSAGDINTKNLQEIIILELNESKNVVEDARAFASLLPNHKGIVVIGKEDAITTLRGLKDMGLYYLFWPINKQDTIDFLRHMHTNLTRFSGVSQNRKAKKVAVIGSKGGLGTSLISAEIASKLSSLGTDTILVDHQYHESNLDIILGLKNFEKQNVENLGLKFNDADEDSAADYLLPVDNRLRILALQGNNSVIDLLGYSHNIIDVLHRQANFIIEDYSASVDFKLDIPLLTKRVDMVVLVVDRTVAAVRSARKIIESITLLQESEQRELRLFVMINSHRPDDCFPMTRKEVATHLEHAVDAELSYSNNVAGMLLQGKRLHRNKGELFNAFDDISCLLQGREIRRSNQKLTLKALVNWIKR